MRAGEFERDARWIKGTIPDILQGHDGPDKVVGVFEVGVRLPELNQKKPVRSRTELLQYLRTLAIRAQIFGESPSIGHASIQGSPPEYATTAPEDTLIIDYRPMSEKDIPTWPGVIVKLDKEEVTNGNV